MKNSKILFAVILLTSFTGCKKFLDETPTSHLSTSSYYQTSDDAVRAVTDVYRLMKDQAYGGYSPSSFGDIMADDANKGGGGASDQSLIQDLKTFVAKADNGYVYNAWRDNFKGIYLANLVLQKVPAINMDAKLKTQVLGEAQWLRGYFYLQLVRLFGNVPLIKSPIDNGDYNVPQSPEADVLASIEADANAAINSLPDKNSQATSDLGRATKGAAQALLLEVYMWEKKWAQAQQIGDAIINSGEYSLTTDVTKNWTLAGEFGPESIFEVNCEDIPGKGTGNLLNLFDAPRNTWGYGFVVPSQSLVNEFEKGDPRFKATVITNNESLPDGTVANTTVSETGYWNMKYWLKVSEIPTNNGGGTGDGPTNDRVYQLAQVMLWTAEAAFHNGDITHATVLVNQIRDRARKSGGNTDQTILPDYGTVTLDNIYHEMRVETALGEHRRWYELIRTGRAAALLPNFKAGINEHIPIPLTEVQLSGGVLKQNPGY
ncbi:RagB/SusD family nutrient uptake outer membrane protein [Mucilaginibacter jinjuensis]|uniref:RagB/SusD family nutrient uptake outer membrane protein n=1 Tax=Mucilaginibacter jinjuensis TaxID=1176721 RepID=A0ABY7TEJ4_9SPHI|nr:RagB/SusD family nutrient uptake outer membrane protein [Mucilaginibacter jinjuensis]WCT14881.1 RagB/SusD family nutrient uptake outer membrane protein [Mucilaginibacter jinjuensis]